MIDFLSANLPIVICSIVGIALLVAEAFMPGFGVAGISGIVLVTIAVVLTYLAHGGLAALGLAIVVLAVIGISISMSLRSATKGRLSKSPLILNESETTAAGFIATADMDVFLGREGITTTILRPTGMAEFDGVKLNVVSDGEYIAKGVHVKVDRVDGARVIVRVIHNPRANAHEEAKPAL
ncbi:MAG TPA: NfeD family protein [Candidatus Limiplasma sp.]|nr:NfeD family protein [Candidatus Limiplasma sp.]HPS81040.1 NfeD family protein [Candidatus Limiplasma sp.]